MKRIIDHYTAKDTVAAKNLLNSDFLQLQLDHDFYLNLVKEYLLIGGMPAAVQDWINHEYLILIDKILINMQKNIKLNILKKYLITFLLVWGKSLNMKRSKVAFASDNFLRR